MFNLIPGQGLGHGSSRRLAFGLGGPPKKVLPPPAFINITTSGVSGRRHTIVPDNLIKVARIDFESKTPVINFKSKLPTAYIIGKKPLLHFTGQNVSTTYNKKKLITTFEGRIPMIEFNSKKPGISFNSKGPIIVIEADHANTK